MRRHIAAAVPALALALGATTYGQVRPFQQPGKVGPAIVQPQALPCVPTEMTVRLGTAENPPHAFASLANALHFAESKKLCAVVIDVGAGTHPGDFMITQPTTLKGHPGTVVSGPIRGLGGFELRIQDLAISNAPDVSLIQVGGRVTLRNVTISFTRRTSSAVRSGTAIELHGKAQGHFTKLTLEGNEGVALYLDGEGTIGWAFDLAVRKNHVHPAARDQLIKSSVFNHVSAVEVADKAELYVDRYEIADNEMCGVLVRHRAAAQLRNGTISGTTSYKPTGSDTAYGGEGVISATEGRVELNFFKAFNVQGCGLFVKDAFMKAAQGEVHDDALGLCAFGGVQGFDLTCVLGPTVRFYKNGENVQAESLPVPDPACSLPNPPPRCAQAACPGVPWRLEQ
jgi:hypothetical protein